MLHANCCDYDDDYYHKDDCDDGTDDDDNNDCCTIYLLTTICVRTECLRRAFNFGCHLTSRRLLGFWKSWGYLAPDRRSHENHVSGILISPHGNTIPCCLSRATSQCRLPPRKRSHCSMPHTSGDLALGNESWLVGSGLLGL